MATNNYFGFPHSGTQYGATATGTSYPTQQTGYTVAPAAQASSSYGSQRPGYDQAYQVSSNQGTGTPAPTYDYGYGRPSQTYDTSKTYYQQPGAASGYAQQSYDNSQGNAKIAGYSGPQYSAQPTRAAIQPAKTAQYNSNQAYGQSTQYAQAVPSNVAAAPKQPTTTANANNYSNYDAALYSAAATMYVNQQNKANNGPQNSWQNYKKSNQNNGPNKSRIKSQPKPQQLHYCDVCKISCAGPQTYKEHLDGQKHKKRETSLKLAASATNSNANRGNNLHCELCDVTCTGSDAYAAHVRGSKHQKVVKLHQKLGKPIPQTDMSGKKTSKINFVQAGAGPTEQPKPICEIVNPQQPTIVEPVPAPEEEVMQPMQDDIKPVGVEYIEEIKDDEGKILSFNCKLCECKFNDPNAKEMHMKGRRHRLQYKKKVQPDLVVDFKPTPRQRKIAEAKAQRAVMQAEFWNRQRMPEEEDEDPMYWEERRRYEEEYEYMGRMQRVFPGPRNMHMRNGPPMGHPYYNMGPPGRKPETSDDRHVVARHAEIYPKEEDLSNIQRIVAHTERALKFVSDAIAESSKLITCKNDAIAKIEKETENGTASIEGKEYKAKEDGRDNQLFSFQKDSENNHRIVRGVMRVGLLAKGLLLQGDNTVHLVVTCADKPTISLLKRVAAELPIQLKKISEEYTYIISMAPAEGAVLVADGYITVKVSLTSPVLRDPQDSNNAPSTEQRSEDLLPREPCLLALAALRHAKWFQARATGLQSCVMIMRIFRDLCQRNPSWTPLNQWAMELLIEKIISSAGIPLSPGECLRRIMEAIASGILINGPGVLDPCEKEPQDALHLLTKQQREDLTVSAQHFLRLIAFRQIHKVLGMDPLPTTKYQQRPYRFNRKRRRSGTEGLDAEGDGKMVKKDVDVVPTGPGNNQPDGMEADGSILPK